MLGTLSLQSSRHAAVDALRQEHASTAVQVLGIVGFALLAALGAQVRLYVWEVPITLQTMAVYGSGLYLGWRNGLLSMALYLALGMFLPVFAGDGAGPAYLFGAVTGGYLLSYPLSAAAIGALSRRWNSFSGSTLAMVVGAAIIFSVGVLWLHVAAGHATWLESLDKGFFRFVLIDLAKVLVVGLFYAGTRRF